ncbi:hypothetical protein Scep_004210 [Stephania cephalantha]|uniref:Uncharacterized protein n=1 Tax=Stephania cephalantha TaxID=152367 RepID=A0AAP0KS52_9MAGN
MKFLGRTCTPDTCICSPFVLLLLLIYMVSNAGFPHYRVNHTMQTFYFYRVCIFQRLPLDV